MFSKRQIVGAEKARSLQAALGYLSDNDMKWILKLNQVNKCPVMHDNAVTANKIWGANIASLKGKTSPKPVPMDMVEIPTEIRELHHIITLLINFSLSTKYHSF